MTDTYTNNPIPIPNIPNIDNNNNLEPTNNVISNMKNGVLANLYNHKIKIIAVFIAIIGLCLYLGRNTIKNLYCNPEDIINNKLEYIILDSEKKPYRVSKNFFESLMNSSNYEKVNKNYIPMQNKVSQSNKSTKRHKENKLKEDDNLNEENSEINLSDIIEE